MPAKQLHVIFNTHIDPVWIWSRRSGRNAWLNSIASNVALLKENPDLTLHGIRVGDYYRYQMASMLDRESPIFLPEKRGRGNGGQKLVELGGLAVSLLMAPEVFWNPLPQETRDRLAAVFKTYAEGETIIRDAQELRVKESDRIAVTEKVLSAMGADIQGTEDGFLIHGGKALHGARVSSHQDHRIAMSLAVAAQNAEGEVIIEDGDAVRISYPDFFRDLEKLRR
jgi:hypothetical protein